MCIHVVDRCRESYQVWRRVKSSDAPAHVKASIDKLKMQQLTLRLNSYTVDMCDMLWRCWAFTDKQSDNSMFRLIPDSTVKSLGLSHPSMSLSIFLHRAMLGYAFQFLSVVSFIPHSIYLISFVTVMMHCSQVVLSDSVWFAHWNSVKHVLNEQCNHQ